ncbi:hypothetical protein MKCMC460_21950 [Mycobacterium sp. 20KCMC460]|nr:hypothetical protein MKCMC460_21950 [Mycobacterium sp. 20KCMC460]
MPEATACSPSVVADTIMRTIELGVTITDAAVDEKQTTIFCTPVARDPRCPDCGHDGRYRDTVVRPLTDLPVAGCPPGAQGRNPALPLSHTTVRAGGVQPEPRQTCRPTLVDDPSVCPICIAAVNDRPHDHFGDRRRTRVSWHTVSTIAVRTVAAVIAAAGPDRLDGVRVIGVDEHRWLHGDAAPQGSSR